MSGICATGSHVSSPQPTGLKSVGLSLCLPLYPFPCCSTLPHPLCAYSMGSVLAASSPNPTPASGSAGVAGPGLTVPPGFSMPPVSPVIPSASAASGQEGEAESPLPNPGAFEECHRKCKGKHR